MLPIETIKSAIISAISLNHVVLSAQTGSGKSTLVPRYLAELGRVLVVEPRRIACTSLAEYVASLMNTPLGDGVGYAIRMEQVATENTQVTFVTPGVALRWLSEGKLEQYQYIMLDEFHERRWDLDLLLALLKQQNKHKLLVTSATLQSDRITSYLAATSLNAQGRNFSVTKHYLAKDKRQMPDSYQLDVRLVSALDYAMTISEQDVLVFLPGKKEIQQAITAAKIEFSDTYTLTGLHGGSNISEQQAALKSTSKRRIIFATNVAETSLTIPNIDCVIDSGLERRTHLRNGRSVLGLSSISSDSQKQRAGRAGRLKDGHFIALYGEHAPLIAHTPAEIMREDLIDMTLACAANGCHLGELALLESAPSNALEKALERLRQCQAIDSQSNITELGKTLFALPIDVELGYLITAMPNPELAYYMAQASAFIATPQLCYQKSDGPDNAYYLAKKLPQPCDLGILFGLLSNELADEITKVEPGFSEASALAKHLVQLLELPLPRRTVDLHALKLAIAKALPHTVYIKKSGRGRGYANGFGELQISKNSVIDDSANAILVLKSHVLAGRAVKDSRTIATIVSEISTQQLNQLAPGDLLLENVKLGEDGQLIGLFSNVYANQVLSHSEHAIDSNNLIQALILAVKEGILLPGLWQALEQQYALSALYCQLEQLVVEVHQPQTHLQQLLQELEITSLDEFAMFSSDDFYYQVIPSWQREAFSERYPVSVQLPELSMRVEYNLPAKRVLLSYCSGRRKDAPKRWELPRFEGFRVQYQKASKLVDIK